MSISLGQVPFAYGDLISISHEGPVTHLWFLAKDGTIRGVPVDRRDPSGPKLGGEHEMVIKRGGMTDTSARASLHQTR